MLSKIKSHLAGKAVSYHLNAESDAADAVQICQIVNKKKKIPKTNYRLHQIFQTWPKDKTKQALAAYSLYYNNGYVDHVFARLISVLASFSLPESEIYLNSKLSLVDYFYPWADVLFNRSDRIQLFFTMHQINSQAYTHQDLLEMVISMQRINIEVNKKTISAFSQNKNHPKINQINIISQQVPDPDTFIASAISTQKSAIFWDKVFVLLLQISLKMQQIF